MPTFKLLWIIPPPFIRNVIRKSHQFSQDITHISDFIKRSSGLLHPPEQPAPALDRPLCEEMLPTAQFKPPLVHLEAVKAVPAHWAQLCRFTRTSLHHTSGLKQQVSRVTQNLPIPTQVPSLLLSLEGEGKLSSGLRMKNVIKASPSNLGSTCMWELCHCLKANLFFLHENRGEKTYKNWNSV